MIRLLKRSVAIYQSEGLKSLTKSSLRYTIDSLSIVTEPKKLYSNYLRTRTKISNKRVVELNGVPYHPDRTFDRFLPWDFTPDTPSEYESGTIEALKQHVENGDQVVVIGGGRGITAVVAAREAGVDGSVTVYEGAKHLVEQIKDTAKLNAVSDRISVNHKIVGGKYSLDGPSRDVETIDGNDLPECDVLEMDCEGAEKDILTVLTIQPRNIILETHNNAEEIRQMLWNDGYDILNQKPAETRLSMEQIEDWGLYTITAESSGRGEE